jgi:hypothetical protein
VVTVFFDECYDNAHNYLILAALFNPEPHKIHRIFRQEKRDKNYLHPDGTVREIKYSHCITHYHYQIAKCAIDCFKNSSSSFRAIVIDQNPNAGFSFDYFGTPNEHRAIKEARAYKKFTELLLCSNMVNISGGTLYTDRLTRCKGDAFISLITELFGDINGKYSKGKVEPVFKNIEEVDTALEQYHLGQIGDILQGVILCELIPPKNRWKRELNKYVKRQLNLNSLGQVYWQNLPKWKQDLIHPKYQIWYWQPGEN